MNTGNNVYYPLQEGFEWTYQLKDGTIYSNKVLGNNPQNQNEYFMINSMMKKKQIVRKSGEGYYTDNYEAGTLHLFLKDNLTLHEEWEIKFKANGFDNILTMKVKEKGISKEVNKVIYHNVIQI